MLLPLLLGHSSYPTGGDNVACVPFTRLPVPSAMFHVRGTGATAGGRRANPARVLRTFWPVPGAVFQIR